MRNLIPINIHQGFMLLQACPESGYQTNRLGKQKHEDLII